MSTLKSRWFIIVVALAAFGYSACSKQEQSDSAQESNGQNQAATQSLPEPKLTRAEAEQIVLKKFPESYLISGELEWDEGKWVYAVETRAKNFVYEISIDAMTGEVIETDDNTIKFQEDSVAGKAPLIPVNLAERDAAEEVALKQHPGKTQKWKAVADSTGRAMFSFKIETDKGFRRVFVAAGTNEIIKRNRQTAAKSEE